PSHHALILLYKHFDLIIVNALVAPPLHPPAPPKRPRTVVIPAPPSDLTLHSKKSKLDPTTTPILPSSPTGEGVAALSLLAMGDKETANKTKTGSMRNKLDLHNDMITWLKKECKILKEKARGCKIAIEIGNKDEQLMEEMDKRIKAIEEEQQKFRNKQCDILSLLKGNKDILSSITIVLESNKGKEKSKYGTSIKDIKDNLGTLKKNLTKPTKQWLEML
ncbi:hypothetical protein KI387_023940, partial [Taxus chinensis]